MKYFGWLWFWVLQLLQFVVLVPVGAVLLIPLCWFRLWVMATPRSYKDRQVLVWRGGILTWLWGCDETGVVPPDWYMPGRDDRWRAYMWGAVRNNVGNLSYAAAWKGGPWWQIHFTVHGDPWYAQAGFRPDNGWPVLSGGEGHGSNWYG